MMFVSRFLSRYSYGVVDTDDGTESVVASKDIITAVSDLNLEVMGTIVNVADGKRSVVGIRPYQLEKYLRSIQVKTNLLHRVQVTTYRNMITNILWHPGDITEPVTLRLSDFGKSVGDRVFFGNEDAGCHKITVILDDKLEFSENSLMKPIAPLCKSGIGIVFDMHDMQDDGNVYWIYKKLINGLNGVDMLDSISDCEERKKTICSEMFGKACKRRM